MFNNTSVEYISLVKHCVSATVITCNDKYEFNFDESGFDRDIEGKDFA